MLRVAERQIEVAHVVMQKHVPDEFDGVHCRACCWRTYPCEPRRRARRLLIEVGHLVPDVRRGLRLVKGGKVGDDRAGVDQPTMELAAC